LLLRLHLIKRLLAAFVFAVVSAAAAVIARQQRQQ